MTSNALSRLRAVFDDPNAAKWSRAHAAELFAIIADLQGALNVSRNTVTQLQGEVAGARAALARRTADEPEAGTLGERLVEHNALLRTLIVQTVVAATDGGIDEQLLKRIRAYVTLPDSVRAAPPPEREPTAEEMSAFLTKFYTIAPARMEFYRDVLRRWTRHYSSATKGDSHEA